MNYLAIDSSTHIFSIAVLRNGKVAASSNFKLGRILSESMIPKIDSILKRANLPLSKIDGFVLGLGPGSFTSLRVGLSTIKGLAFATKKPVFSIGSLDLVAANVKNDARQICVMMDARRGLVYGCVYVNKNGVLKKKGKYHLCPIEEMIEKLGKDVIFVGDGIAVFKDEIETLCKKKKINFHFEDEKKWYPKAKSLFPLTEEKIKSKKADDIAKLVPIYLYPQDCQVRRK